MLKYFREIRQISLYKKQFPRYLSYAVGEIILVVIGILIALSINTWNQNRLNQKREIEILVNVKEELESVKLRLDQWSTFNRTGQRLTDNILKFEPENFERKRMDSLFSSILYVNVFDKGGGVLETLIFEGKLDLIRDESIREQLSGWPDMLEDIHTNDLSMRNFVWHEIIPFLSEFGIPEFRCETGITYCTQDGPVPEAYPDLLENKQFMALLRSRNVGFMMIANDHDAKANEAKKTLNLINIYLNSIQ